MQIVNTIIRTKEEETSHPHSNESDTIQLLYPPCVLLLPSGSVWYLKEQTKTAGQLQANYTLASD